MRGVSLPRPCTGQLGVFPHGGVFPATPRSRKHHQCSPHTRSNSDSERFKREVFPAYAGSFGILHYAAKAMVFPATRGCSLGCFCVFARGVPAYGGVPPASMMACAARCSAAGVFLVQDCSPLAIVFPHTRGCPYSDLAEPPSLFRIRGVFHALSVPVAYYRVFPHTRGCSYDLRYTNRHIRVPAYEVPQ